MRFLLSNRQEITCFSCFIVLLAFSFFGEGYFLFQCTKVLAIAIAILGLNLLCGFGGQLSLGHGALFGIGAYVAAILIKIADLSRVVAVGGATVVCLTFGLLFAVPSLRLQKQSLALASFALAVIFPQIMLKTSGQLGGATGISFERAKSPLPFMNQDQWLYISILLVYFVVHCLVQNLIRSHLGRSLIATKDSEVAARSSGIDVSKTKIWVFGISAMLAGLGGAMSAISIGHVAPETFSYLFSTYLVVGLLVGGLSSEYGALRGAAFIQFIPNYTEAISKSLTMAIFGLLLILSLVFWSRLSDLASFGWSRLVFKLRARPY